IRSSQPNAREPGSDFPSAWRSSRGTTASFASKASSGAARSPPCSSRCDRLDMARVLLVDGERQLRHVPTALLSEHGPVVTAAESGEQALELATRARPDVLLLDLTLPGMNGLDTFKRLHDQFPAAGCIFLTAYGTIRSAVDAIRAGGDDYLTKPFDNDELLIAIDRVLEMRRLSREVDELRQELTT